MKFIMIVLLAVFLVSVKSITAKADELSCLAEAVYFEARSEPFVAQLAVANVILTRVDSHRFPDNICDVVHQAKKWKGKPIRNKCQFSYWCDGKPETIANVGAYQESVSAQSLPYRVLSSVRQVVPRTIMLLMSHRTGQWTKTSWC